MDSHDWLEEVRRLGLFRKDLASKNELREGLAIRLAQWGVLIGLFALLATLVAGQSFTEGEDPLFFLWLLVERIRHS